jgi:hypothetical protein
LVTKTEVWLGYWQRAFSTLKPGRLPSNRWLDALQVLVWTLGVLLLAGVFLVGTGPSLNGGRALYWRIGNNSLPLLEAKVFVNGRASLVVGLPGDTVRWRAGQAQVRKAGAELWHPIGPSLFAPEVSVVYYALLPEAARAQVLDSLGREVSRAGSNARNTVSDHGWLDAAEWQARTAEVLQAFEPDNIEAQQILGRYLNGLFVPTGQVAVLTEGKIGLVGVQQVQGILAEGEHGR